MRAAVTLIGVAVLGAACAGTPATPEQRRLAEQRLLGPFLRDTQVVANELVIEITRNFHGNVGQPAVDQTAHEFRKERGDGYVDTIWTNKLGELRSAFVVTIGEAAQFTEKGLQQGQQTRFKVLNQVRLRVYEDARALTLNARASGPILLVQEASAKPSEVAVFEIADGVMRKQ
ncbi:MAG: hypothetical protein H6838_20370 [Planctomycetes bacterium]|nr:hypothetical protein [Planctomycetota bacterium]